MNRIKQLREQRGMTQPELGKVLNVQGAAISKYENEKIPLTTETIKTLAEFFGTSTDYLLGKTDDKESQEQNEPQPTIHSISCAEITSRIKNLFLTSEKSINDLLPMLKTDILNGKCSDITAFMQDVYIISDFFGVTDEYILGGKELETRTDYSLSDETIKFISSFQQLSQDNKDIILGDMKKYIKEQAYESVAADDLGKTGTGPK